MVSSSEQHSCYLNLYKFAQDVNQKKNFITGLEIQFILDTGAASSILNYETFQALSNLTYIPLIKNHNKLVAANGGNIDILGICSIKLYLNLEATHACVIKFYVSNRNIATPNLLGMNFFNEQIKGIAFDSGYLIYKGGNGEAKLRFYTNSQKLSILCTSRRS